MFNGEAVEASCTGVNYIRKGRETDLQKALVIEGPVTVAIDSRRSSFQVSGWTASVHTQAEITVQSKYYILMASYSKSPDHSHLSSNHFLYDVQFYSSGIYNEPFCSSKRLTHSMLLVGYGTKNGTDYWLLKNRCRQISSLSMSTLINFCHWIY